MGVSEIEQDGGRFALGVTGSSVDQQFRTAYCAPKYARDSLNLNHFGGLRIVFRRFALDAKGGEVEFWMGKD